MGDMEQVLRAKLAQPKAYTNAEVAWLCAHIGDPNPAVRDGLVYETLCAGVEKHAFTRAQMQTFAAYSVDHDLVMTDIKHNGDVTVTRTFAALLNVVLLDANLHDYADFLTPAQLEYLLTRAPEYLRAETDRRGYDPQLGWVHALAHGADYLGVCTSYPANAASQILPLFTDIFLGAQTAFGDGEPARLAMVLYLALQNGQLTQTAVAQWLKTMQPQLRDDAHHFGSYGVQQLITHLYVVLATDNALTDELRTTIQDGIWG